MSTLSKKITAKFALVAVIVMPALGLVAATGLMSLSSAKGTASALYEDYLATTLATADLASHFGTAYQTTQQLLMSEDHAVRGQFRRQLFEHDIPSAEISLETFRTIHAGDEAAEKREVDGVVNDWNGFKELLDDENGVVDSGATVALARKLDATFRPISVKLESFLHFEQVEAADAHQHVEHVYQRSRWVIAIVLAAAVVGILAALLLVTRRLLPNMLSGEETQVEFADTLQLAEDEEEAHDLLKRHLERALPGTDAVVFNRNNSADRLEAVTALGADSPLRAALVDADPRACLAVRSARRHVEDPDQPPLLSCELCSTCPGVSTCSPMTVGGEVIGSVLVSGARPLNDDEDRRIKDSVSQAAPVLANLRNLAVAEFRASTDGLTGLPNKRAAQDVIKRMAAQASRTGTPLAALLLDLDHFKQVNDQYGHAQGDEMLAAVGAALSATLRDADFAARNGGEEFMVLLPNTDVDGALMIAERIQRAFAEIYVAGVDRRVTASMGLATLPVHADGAAALERAADRALYVAKEHGRDRVEIATAPGSTDIAPVLAISTNGSHPAIS
ncbi:MAG TPA: GGDEF domain-containing protein [Acidimicrobiales bacterium]|nr:GGDEF domain-containing protein [Acidimicrobiales bacterium]